MCGSQTYSVFIRVDGSDRIPEVQVLNRLNLNLLEPPIELWHCILALIHDKTGFGAASSQLLFDPYRMVHLIYPYPLNLILQEMTCITSSVRFGAYLRD